MRNIRSAYFFSLVLHPLLMPSYLFLFIIVFASTLLQPIQKESLFQVLGVIFIVTFIIPAISIGTLRISNFITDLNLSDRKQRFTPFLFVTCFYGITAYMFYTKLQLNSLIFLIFATITCLLLALTLITTFWKISVHAAGLGGTLGFILALRMIYTIPHFNYVLAALSISSGLVAYSRLALQAHSPAQVYIGYLLGLFLCYASLYFFL